MNLVIIVSPNEEFWQQFDCLSCSSFKHNVQFKSAWLKPYVNHLLQGSLYIIAVYDKDLLVGCLPLELSLKRATRFWNYRVFSILGSGPTDFFEVLAKGDKRNEILILMLNHLKESKNWDYLNLNFLPQDSGSCGLIDQVFKKASFKVSQHLSAGFRYEKTTTNWDVYYKEVFSNKNKDLSKGERRIQNDGIEYTFKVYTNNIFEHFIGAVDLYASRRDTLGQYNYYQDKHYRTFLKDVCSNYEKFGGVIFTVMQNKNEENIAMQLDFINKGVRYHWNHAFNEDYKRYSPGKILLKEILKNSFKDPNIVACNHMRGLSKYKESFTSYQEIMPSYRIERKDSMRISSTRLVSKILKFFR